MFWFFIPFCLLCFLDRKVFNFDFNLIDLVCFLLWVVNWNSIDFFAFFLGFEFELELDLDYLFRENCNLFWSLSLSLSLRLEWLPLGIGLIFAWNLCFKFFRILELVCLTLEIVEHLEIHLNYVGFGCLIKKKKAKLFCLNNNMNSKCSKWRLGFYEVFQTGEMISKRKWIWIWWFKTPLDLSRLLRFVLFFVTFRQWLRQIMWTNLVYFLSNLFLFFCGFFLSTKWFPVKLKVNFLILLFEFSIFN